MQKIIDQIHKIAGEIERDILLMEVCGTHTETVAKYGIGKVLPPNVKLISGPGCPVCVTDQKDVDNVVELALQGIPIATYGDVLKVPGNQMSLEEARTRSAKVFAVYSTEDIFEDEKIGPHIKELVFFGIGFDTTTPMTASVIKRGITVYSTHKKFIPALEALLKDPQIKIDGLIDPGHVSTIIGSLPYRRLNIPQVIAGFEAEDVLLAVYMLLKQLKENKPRVENEYKRSVRKEGNKKALALINEVFEAKDGFWRGFGAIPSSGFEIRKKYEEFDAKVKYKELLDNLSVKENPKLKLCQCGKIVKGIMSPNQCKLFGKNCTPESPLGPCMVSREGACNVRYRFGKGGRDQFCKS